MNLDLITKLSPSKNKKKKGVFMNKKTIIAASFTSLLTIATMAALSISSNNQFNSFYGVKAATSWTEKAYVAPTSDSVGYKHYYLGCPGNYRTSDAEHLQDVSLEDITIPQLNVINRSQIDTNDGILNVNEAKIKYLDQTTTLGEEPGVATFVRDSGRDAIFFSRSNELGDDHYSEFRFTTTSNDLTSVTFDYRYLDFNETHVASDGGGHHSFFELRVNGSYERVYYDLINDDAWHSATIPVRQDDVDNVEAILFNIYEFQGHCYVSNLHFNGFDDLSLESASALDATNPVTISDLGLTSGMTVTDAGHKFGSYDFVTNKNLDFWFDIDYSVVSSDSYFYLYFFNAENEDGAVFRYQVNRTQDDGIVTLYLHTNSGKTNTGTTMPTSPLTHYFPRKSGIKSTLDVSIHITAECIDETNNTFKLTFTGGVRGGEQWYPSTNPEALTNEVLTYNVELGANYFDDGNHNKIRFSCKNDASVTFNDLASEEKFVVYKDAFGNVVGKTNNTTIALPNYSVEDKTLVGWFDLNGNKVVDNQTVTTKTIVRPVFTNTKANMMTLRDFGIADRDYEASCGETISPTGANVTNSLDVYFTYKFYSSTSNDNYMVLGIPYDGIDAKTRLLIRIDNNNDTNLKGYISGGSLGSAGAEGTSFSTSGFRGTLQQTLLVHISLVDNGSNSATITVEFTNLVTDAVYSTSRNVTFSVDWGLGASYVNRNKFGISNCINCNTTIRSVF